MLTNCSYLCSPTVSYQLNYKIQLTMYDYLDKNQKKIAWKTTCGMAFHFASTFVTLVTRIAGLVEPLLKGFYMLVNAPFGENFMENTKLGLYEICEHTSKNILRTLCVPFEFFIDTVVVYMDPKFFNLTVHETMKVNSKHANMRTIGSEQHRSDLREIDEKVKYILSSFEYKAHKNSGEI